MDLGLRSSGADRSPGYEVCSVLRSNGIKELAAGWEAHLCDVEEEASSDSQALVDLEAVVEVGVVDETFPANGGTGFLEVNAHDDVEVIFCGLSVIAEQTSIFEGGLDVVDGAGTLRICLSMYLCDWTTVDIPDHYQESIIIAFDDLFCRQSPLQDCLGCEEGPLAK